jgi:hypothetical protein
MAGSRAAVGCIDGSEARGHVASEIEMNSSNDAVIRQLNACVRSEPAMSTVRETLSRVARERYVERRSELGDDSTLHLAPIVGRIRAVGMVSFHTVAAHELVEEKPVREDDLDGETRQERYAG